MSRLVDTIGDLALGPRRNRPAPFGLLLLLALLLAIGLLLVPAFGEWWRGLFVILVADVLFVIVRVVVALSSFGGPAVRLIREVRDLRGDSFVFMSLLSSTVVASLDRLGIPASLRRVWMAVAVSPRGVELWTEPGQMPAYTIAWSAISSIRSGVEMLGARYRNDADQTSELEITVDTAAGSLDFQLGVFDDRKNPAGRELLEQVGAALHRYRPTA